MKYERSTYESAQQVCDTLLKRIRDLKFEITVEVYRLNALRMKQWISSLLIAMGKDTQ